MTVISERVFRNVDLLEVHLTLKDETASGWFEDPARTAQETVSFIKSYQLMLYRSSVPRGGLGCSNTPPRKSEGPPNLYQTQPDLWKLLKIAEFGTPTPQDVQKKDN